MSPAGPPVLTGAIDPTVLDVPAEARFDGERVRSVWLTLRGATVVRHDDAAIVDPTASGPLGAWMDETMDVEDAAVLFSVAVARRATAFAPARSQVHLPHGRHDSLVVFRPSECTNEGACIDDLVDRVAARIAAEPGSGATETLRRLALDRSYCCVGVAPFDALDVRTRGDVVTSAPDVSGVTELERDVLGRIDPLGLRWAGRIGDAVEWTRDMDSSGLSRLARTVYWARPDLVDAFDPVETTIDTFSDWFQQAVIGDPAPNLGRRLARRIRRGRRTDGGVPVGTLASVRRAPEEASGVNVIGFLASSTGLGAVGRSVLAALPETGSEMGALDLSYRIDDESHPDPAPSSGALHDVSVFCLNPGEILDYAVDSLRYRIGQSWNVGFFFWETETIPTGWGRAIASMDSIWVGSSFVGEAFRRITETPVHVVGLPIDIPPPRPDADNRVFTVAYIANLGSGANRKNPIAAVRAFVAAFGDDPASARLVLKLGDLEREPELRTEILEASRGLDVQLLDRWMPDAEIAALIGRSDAYLSLHRSEGLGLTIMDAMAHGVPVVATGYGGCTDYLEDAGAYVVDHELVTTPGTAWPYGGHVMADPDIDHAARLLRQIREHPEEADVRGASGREVMATRYSRSQFTDRVIGALTADGVGFAEASSTRSLPTLLDGLAFDEGLIR